MAATAESMGRTSALRERRPGRSEAVSGRALLACGGRLFPIPDPTQNRCAEMWRRFGVDLPAPR